MKEKNFLSCALLLIAFALNSSAVSGNSNPPAAGIYSLGVESLAADELQSLASNPHVDGFSIRIGWDRVERKEGNYNWNAIDSIIATGKNAGKKVMLRVLAGHSSPAWVYANGAAEYRYLGPRGTGERTMPIPWDRAYLSSLRSFIKAFGQKYDGEAAVSVIQMNGAGEGGEMYLPDRSNEFKWKSSGYSAAALTNAWKQVIDAYAEAFPTKLLAIDIAKPVDFGDAEIIEDDVIFYCYQKLATRCVVQYNGLRADSPNDADYAKVKDYSTRGTTGFQFVWSYSNDSNRVGNFKTAVQNALDAKARYVEFYSEDIANAALAVELKYAHDGLYLQQSPAGWFDSVSTEGVASGWALDPDTPTQAIDVHVFIDGPLVGPATYGISVKANLSRPDVNSVTGYPGDH